MSAVMNESAYLVKNGDRVIARPFVKFAGGKTKLLPEIRKRMPKDFVNYFEPFVGGGAVFFDVQAQHGASKRYTLADKNDELIAAWRMIRDDHRELIRKLRGMRNVEEIFYRVRAEKLDTLSELERAARMIYLNKTCFNGLYRVNSKGEFNTPFGKYEKPVICDVENILAVHVALNASTTMIATDDFERTLSRAKTNDFVFLDPPYYPVKKDSFVGYGADRFLPAVHERLRDVMTRLRDRGVHVMLTNSDTPAVRKLWKPSEGWKVSSVQVARSINSKGDARGKVGEVIITAKP